MTNRTVHIIGGGTVNHVRPHLALSAPAYGGTARRLKELALAGGSKLIRTAALELVQSGATTLLEANRVTALA